MKESVITRGMLRIVEVSKELSLCTDLHQLMAVVRRAARDITGADGATFVLRDGNFCHYADEDAIEPLWKGMRFPIGQCISGWSMLNARPAVIEDIYSDDRIPHDAYRPTFVKSLVMVPIRSEKPIGAIGNYWASRHQPTAEELTVLQALADITSVGIENVQHLSCLEEKVAERTRELENLNKDLQAFSYSVSHDLKAPLKSIQSLVNILCDNNNGKFDVSSLRCIDMIKGKTLEMNQLIEGLLEFSKLGKKDLTCAQVPMQDLFREICNNLQEQETGRSIEFLIEDMPSANADPVLVKQVCTNLVSNAVKYTRKKQNAVIRIGCDRENGRNAYYVKDNGAGFDMKYYERLFNPFQRLHSRNDFEGFGIGLAIVDRIVSKHGGRVWAKAEPNEGAEFHFSLAEA